MSTSSDDYRVISSREDAPVSAERVRRGWLLTIGALGLSAVVSYVVLELNEVGGPWSGLALELGAGVLLFAVLFLLERRIVANAVTTALARISKDDKEQMWADPLSNPLTPGDFYSEIGPLAVAGAFVRDLADGNFEEAWLLADANWRLCRAQAWIFNNLKALGVSDQASRDVMAAHLAAGPHANDSTWKSFASIEAAAFMSLLGDFDDDKWGWSQRRRIVGPTHELILAMPLPSDAPDGFVVDKPTILTESIKVLIGAHVVEEGVFYLVAGLNNETAPTPGWPPTWWALEDPVALATHPGLAGDPGPA